MEATSAPPVTFHGLNLPAEIAQRTIAKHCEAMNSGRLKIGAPLGTIDRFEYGIIHCLGEGSMILNFEPYPFQGVEGKVPLSTSV